MRKEVSERLQTCENAEYHLQKLCMEHHIENDGNNYWYQTKNKTVFLSTYTTYKYRNKRDEYGFFVIQNFLLTKEIKLETHSITHKPINKEIEWHLGMEKAGIYRYFKKELKKTGNF